MGKQLNIRIHAHNFATVLRLARDNIGVALVPRRVLENNLPKDSCAVVELSDEWALRRLKVVAHEIGKASQFTKNLVDHLLLRADSLPSDELLPDISMLAVDRTATRLRKVSRHLRADATQCSGFLRTS